MTTTIQINNGGAVAIWPEHEGSTDYGYEHAIIVVPYADSIALEQNGNSINVPLYALSQVLRAMRTVGKTAEGK